MEKSANPIYKPVKWKIAANCSVVAPKLQSKSQGVYIGDFKKSP
jgi:hypothetical protein